MTQSNPFIALMLLIMIIVSVLLTPSGAVFLNDDNIHDAVKDHLDGGDRYGRIEWWYTYGVTNMTGLFKDTSFNGLISGWDVSRVTSMRDMFYNARSFNGNLNDWWDVSNVTNMDYMFYKASSFDQDLNNWNVSKVKSMNSMFEEASLFDRDLNNWDVSNVTDMALMFHSASLFDQDLNNWDVSKVADMWSMFFYAYSFDQDLNNWDVSKVTNMWSMFHGASLFNKDLNNWDVSNVTHMAAMFLGASSFDQALNDWDVSKATNMWLMFYDASSFDRELCWDISGVVSNMDEMFVGSPGSIAPYPECLPPTPQPSASPSASPTTGQDPVKIISSLSPSNQTWCLAPANSVFTGASLALRDCTTVNYKSFQWSIDENGRIMNLKDLSLCIEGKGKKLKLAKCNGSVEQKWMYSSNGGRVVLTKNGRKRIAVVGSETPNSLVKILSSGGSATPSQAWTIGTVPLPSHDKFLIVSGLSTDDQRWCLFPENNKLKPNTFMTLQECLPWKAWQMDMKGRISFNRNDQQCIESKGSKMWMKTCSDDKVKMRQRWTYSVLDNKLVTLKNGRSQATVQGNNASVNLEVRLQATKAPGSPLQKWVMEEVV